MDAYCAHIGKFSLTVQRTREGFKQYVSGSEVCKTCSFLDNCTQSQNHTWKTLCSA